MRKSALFLLMLVAATVTATAETVHKRVTPDGTVEFSDEPMPGSVPIELPDVQTLQAQPLPPASIPSPTPTQPAAPVYQAIQITQPTHEQTLFFDAAGIGVNVSVQPGVQPGHRVVIYVDGQPVAAGPTTSLTMPTPTRGTHQLTAEVQDSAGQVVLRSAPVTFHLIQHSRLHR